MVDHFALAGDQGHVTGEITSLDLGVEDFLDVGEAFGGEADGFGVGLGEFCREGDKNKRPEGECGNEAAHR